jgi:hypothetical protein
VSFRRLIYVSGFFHFSGSRLSEILGCCGFGDLITELCLGPGGCLFSFYCCCNCGTFHSYVEIHKECCARRESNESLTCMLEKPCKGIGCNCRA